MKLKIGATAKALGISPKLFDSTRTIAVIPMLRMGRMGKHGSSGRDDKGGGGSKKS
jgi:hypothetical protein